MWHQEPMTETSPITIETVIIREPGGAEVRWRALRMVSLGADAALAEAIANSDVDVHDIERLLKAGCPLDVAWTITRPSDEPEAAVDSAVEPVSADDES
jgi:hypothetical protein